MYSIALTDHINLLGQKYSVLKDRSFPEYPIIRPWLITPGVANMASLVHINIFSNTI